MSVMILLVSDDSTVATVSNVNPLVIQLDASHGHSYLNVGWLFVHSLLSMYEKCTGYSILFVRSRCDVESHGCIK